MDNKEYAMNIACKWLRNGQLLLVGTKTINGHMFIKGADYGFPHALGYCEVDLNTNVIVKYYNAHNCPVKISDGVFE